MALFDALCYDMLRYATVIVYNEQLPKSWGDKFSKISKISGSVCFIFWPIPKSSEITSQVTWELTIFVCTFRIVSVIYFLVNRQCAGMSTGCWGILMILVWFNRSIPAQKTVLSLQKPPPQYFLDQSQNHGAKDICASLMTNKKQRGMSIWGYDMTRKNIPIKPMA